MSADIRNIISHATGGHTTGEGMTTNDICVEITRLRNSVYQDGKDAARADSARLIAMAVEASEKLGAWMSAALEDPKVCDAMKADIEAWFASLDEITTALGRGGDT